MLDAMITFRSVLPAQQAHRVLLHAGFRCVLRRTPRALQSRGCGYSLYLPSGQLDRAVRLLKGQSVSFGKVYTAAHTELPREVVV